MPTADELVLDFTRDVASEGLESFREKRDRYESNPNPSPGAGPSGGVALPGMGRKKGGGSGGGRGGRGPSRREQEKWRKESERAALQAMMEARRDFIPSLFDGARVDYKGGRTPGDEARTAAGEFADSARKNVQGAVSDHRDGRSVAPGGSPDKTVSRPSVGGPKEVGRKLVEALGDLEPGELASLEGPVAELAGDVIADIGSSVMPLVGTAKAGATAAGRWAGTGKAQVKVRKTAKAQVKVVQGDPERAVASVKRLLKRERNAMAAEASLATAKVGGDVAGYFVDLGIATNAAAGAAEALGRLALEIRLLLRDAREMKAANELLGGQLDARMFQACPLLGAYAVAAADTSALVGFLGGDPQRHGFTLDDLDKIVRNHGQPAVDSAVEMIERSRLEVVGMTTDRAQVRAKVRSEQGSLRRRLVARVEKALGRKSRR